MRTILQHMVATDIFQQLSQGLGPEEITNGYYDASEREKSCSLNVVVSKSRNVPSMDIVYLKGHHDNIDKIEKNILYCRKASETHFPRSIFNLKSYIRITKVLYKF